MSSDREQHLLAEIAAGLADIAARDAIIAHQAAEIVLLKQSIDALTRRIFGATSEKLDPAQLQLLLEGDDTKKPTAAASADPGPAAEIKNHNKRKPKTRAPRIPQHLPLISEELIPAEVQLDPAAYRRIGEEVSQQLGYKAAEFYRLQIIRPKYIRIDNPIAKPQIAPLPPKLQDRCIATPGLIAEVIDNRFTCHLPYYRQSQMFARMGVNLHRKTLCDWTQLAADWLAIIYRQIQYEHWRAHYRQIDETPIHYLEPGNGKTKTGYLWTSNIPGGSVLYHWHPGRDAKGMNALFGELPPEEQSKLDPKHLLLLRIIQCDGYIVYSSWAKDKDWIKLMGCHSHVRRKFFEATEQSPASSPGSCARSPTSTTSKNACAKRKPAPHCEKPSAPPRVVPSMNASKKSSIHWPSVAPSCPKANLEKPSATPSTNGPTFKPTSAMGA